MSMSSNEPSGAVGRRNFLRITGVATMATALASTPLGRATWAHEDSHPLKQSSADASGAQLEFGTISRVVARDAEVRSDETRDVVQAQLEYFNNGWRALAGDRVALLTYPDGHRTAQPFVRSIVAQHLQVETDKLSLDGQRVTLTDSLALRAARDLEGREGPFLVFLIDNELTSDSRVFGVRGGSVKVEDGTQIG